MRIGILIILIEFVLGVLAPLSARQVSLVEAEKIALNWMHSKYPYRDILLSPAQKQLAHNPSSTNTPAYYTITFEPKGWVIVSAESSLKPIIGYSISTISNPNKTPPAFKTWMKNVSKNITQLQKILPSNSSPSLQWKRLSTDRSMLASHDRNDQTTWTKELSTPQWGQGQYYNEYTPKDNAAKYYIGNNHVPTGCVATAMAEIMRFHKWPLKGAGEHTDKFSGYGDLSVNFGNYSYNWDSIPESNLTEPNHEVAKIMYHLGVATNMRYTPAGSGTWADRIIPSFVQNFGYDVSIGTRSKDIIGEQEWRRLIIQDIDHNLPILFAAFDDNGFGGHAFVCDGYYWSRDTDDFWVKINWGWDGEKNGFFSIGKLNPYEDPPVKFNTKNLAFFGVTPRNIKPVIKSVDSVAVISPGVGMVIKGHNFYSGDKDGMRYVTAGDIRVNTTKWTNTEIRFNAPDKLYAPIYVHTESNTSEPALYNVWKQASTSKTPQCSHSSSTSATIAQNTYFFGRRDQTNKCVEIYNHTNEQWQRIADININNRVDSVGELNNTSIYIITSDRNNLIFDTQTHQYTQIDQNSSIHSDDGNLYKGRLINYNNALYYIGGKSSKEIYRLDTSNMKWIHAGELPQPVYGFAITKANNSIYIFGGYDEHNDFTKQILKCSEDADEISCETLEAKVPKEYFKKPNAFVLDDNHIAVWQTEKYGYQDTFNTFIFNTSDDKVEFSKSPLMLIDNMYNNTILSTNDNNSFMFFGRDLNSSNVLTYETNTDQFTPPDISDDITINKKLKMGQSISIDLSEYIGSIDNNQSIEIVKKPIMGKAKIKNTTLTYMPYREGGYEDVFKVDVPDQIILRLQDSTSHAQSNHKITIHITVEPTKPDESGDGGGGSSGGGGGGCSYDPDAKGVDGLMALMLLLSLLYPFVGRTKVFRR